ncbi:MAG TPA: hypothetical protein PK023_03370, partial [Chitinophagaceae bacterium]|nr:hypothetical protein [Chitinophagaceae bacterium]
MIFVATLRSSFCNSVHQFSSSRIKSIATKLPPRWGFQIIYFIILLQRNQSIATKLPPLWGFQIIYFIILLQRNQSIATK